MSKLKTHSGAKKRLRLTATGKVKRAKGGKSHLLESKKSKRKRHLRSAAYASDADMNRIARLLPYS